MFGSPEIFSHSCCGVFFLIAFRSKPGVPFRFFLCLNKALAEANRFMHRFESPEATVA